MGKLMKPLTAALLIVIVLASSFLLWNNGVNEERIDNVEVVDSVSSNMESTTPKPEEESRPQHLDSYVFTVPGVNKQEVTMDEVEEVPDSVLVNDYNKVGSLLVYEVDGLRLDKESLVDGGVVYSWIHGNDIYNVILNCTDSNVNKCDVLYDNLQDSEWCSLNGHILMEKSSLTTLIGEGSAFLYSTDGLIYPTFIAYVNLSNGHTLSIEISGGFTFEEAMYVVENIITNGVSVIIIESEDENEIG